MSPSESHRPALWEIPQLRPSLVIMMGAFLLTTAFGLVLAGGTAILMGPHAGVSTLLAVAAVLVFFGTGVPVQLAALGRTMQVGMGIVLLGYASRVALLGIALVALSRGNTRFRPDAEVFVAALVLSTCVWLAGMVFTAFRTRIPVYDIEFPSSHRRSQ